MIYYFNMIIDLTSSVNITNIIQNFSQENHSLECISFNIIPPYLLIMTCHTDF